MGMDDKARRAVEDTKGKVKEGWGKLTDDDSLETEGRLDQIKASAGEAVDKIGEEITHVARRLSDDE